MQDSRLPIELCELVIGFIQEPEPWWEGYAWWRDEPSELVRYTYICSAWLPRARLVLYRVVVLKEPSQVDLFIRTITEHPWFTDMVGELVIQPKDQGTYIPFVHHTLVRRLHHLKTLVYDFDYQSTWVYPPRHHLLVPRYPITELDIRNPPSTTWSEMFRLIWALPHLQRLSLAMWGPQYDTDSGTSNVNAILRPWSCAQLRTLVIEGRQSYDCLPERAFGTSVKKLALECDVPSGNQYGPLSGQIHLFSSLQELFIGIRLPDRLKKDDFAATAYIVPILTQLPSQDTLRSIITSRQRSCGDDIRGDMTSAPARTVESRSEILAPPPSIARHHRFLQSLRQSLIAAPPIPARTKCRVPDIVRDHLRSHSGSRLSPYPHLDLLSTSNLFPTSTISELPIHVPAMRRAPSSALVESPVNGFELGRTMLTPISPQRRSYSCCTLSTSGMPSLFPYSPNLNVVSSLGGGIR